MTPGTKIFLFVLGAVMLWALVFQGAWAAFSVFVFAGIGCLVLECLQGVVRAVSRLLDGNPRVEYHLYVPAPEKAAHRDPTAPGYEWDDIEMVQVNGVWRKR